MHFVKETPNPTYHALNYPKSVSLAVLPAILFHALRSFLPRSVARTPAFSKEWRRRRSGSTRATRSTLMHRVISRSLRVAPYPARCVVKLPLNNSDSPRMLLWWPERARYQIRAISVSNATGGNGGMLWKASLLAGLFGMFVFGARRICISRCHRVTPGSPLKNHDASDTERIGLRASRGTRKRKESRRFC